MTKSLSDRKSNVHRECYKSPVLIKILYLIRSECYVPDLLYLLEYKYGVKREFLVAQALHPGKERTNL